MISSVNGLQVYDINTYEDTKSVIVLDVTTLQFILPEVDPLV